MVVIGLETEITSDRTDRALCNLNDLIFLALSTALSDRESTKVAEEYDPNTLNLLLPDARFRSPTSIPRWDDRPWLKTVSLEAPPRSSVDCTPIDLQVAFGERHDMVIHEVGCMFENQIDAKLRIQVVNPKERVEEEFETDAIYLVRLFPGLYKLNQRLQVSKYDEVRVRITNSTSSGLVVLGGVARVQTERSP